jgi:hypothetical protein
MAKLDPTVFNRLRLPIDDFTDAAHRLMQQLDGEIADAVGAAKDDLQRHRDLIAGLGYQLDSCDPDGGDAADAWSISKGHGH